MSEKQINQIKWNDKKLRQYNVQNKKHNGRDIIFEPDIDKTIKKEYVELPQNIGRDTFYGVISRKYIGISRRRLYKFLSNQPLYQRGRDRIQQPLAKPIISSRPFERVQIDLIDTSKLSNNVYPFTLTYIDTFSKKVHARPLKNKKEQTVQKELESILKSLPIGATVKLIQSDNGSEFNNISKAFPNSKSIKSSPYNPASNGMIERVHRFIKKYIHFANLTKKATFPHQLKSVLKLYNERKNTITKFTPNELDKVDLDPEIKKQVKERIEKSGRKNSLVERKFPPLSVGDFVRLAIIKTSDLDKLYEQWSEESYEVAQVRKTTPPTYKLKGKSYIYQRDYLLKIPKESEEERKKKEKELTKKQEAEKQKKIDEQEATRQTAQRNRELAKLTKQKKYLYDVGQKLLFSKEWFEKHDKSLVKEFGARTRTGVISSKSKNNYYIKFIDADYKDYKGEQRNIYQKSVVEKDATKL
ncbi:hypothetical protein TL16_g05020 [Triparma laevis f. inornata]|uniref:Integrase catalytic domain-containing protein n=1 Tax=Triparma laevis f. inornata TaxID=1714386 RepID=A0A9W7AGN9_9STRA|nr:hypothetical protein TL16_g05020 [Triparma laevis f. inornata]